jgi:hypothetical protein
MRKEKQIQLSANSVKVLLRDLDLLVVSLDRIGSTFSQDRLKLAVELEKFFSDFNAFKRLARMRKVLCEAYDAQSQKADIERLEAQLDRQKVWRAPK